MTIGEYVTQYVWIVGVLIFVVLPLLVLFAQGPTIIEWFVDRLDEWKDVFDWLKDRKGDKR